jgi:hypothetical protein
MICNYWYTILVSHCVSRVPAEVLQKWMPCSAIGCSLMQSFSKRSLISFLLTCSGKESHTVQASEPDKLHVHWAGMHPRTCLRTFFLSNEMLHVCSKLFAWRLLHYWENICTVSV